MSNKFIIEPGTFLSNIENEEYFPLRVVYDPSIESIRFVGFYYEDSDLLEFTVDRETGLIREMQIVVCNHFQFADHDYQPEPAESSIIRLHYAQHNDCEAFMLTVYNNAIQIILSDESASAFYRFGQVTYGVSPSGELVSVLVSDMSESDIAHTREELSFGIDQ